ncbi:MAG: VacB/RNase II family 3'-5' exoribonuclease [Phycisphaerae bacterium]|nr:VacB/RNase II family 3'-5' exoribonuclease [Phycisphaerae bacterium]
MTIRYRRRILDHLRHASYRPVTAREVGRQLNVADEDLEEFEKTVEQLVVAGRLEMAADERLRLPLYGDSVVGKIRITSRGFGFVIPDEPTREGDLFIPEGYVADAISGDRVRAVVVRKGDRTQRGGGARGGGNDDRNRLFGRVEEILERGQTRFAGVLAKEGRTWLVIPDGRALRDRIVVRDPFAKNPNAKVGDKCVVEITLWGEDGALPEGVILEVLGEAGRPDVETEAIIATYQIRTKFPADALDQAGGSARSFERDAAGPWSDRLDLRGQFIFTIDPPDAKDFDDAISIRHDADAGEWELGIHIADVSHFVSAASPLDHEAQARGTSVYLPRRVIPMLPEALSNGVCSLQEGVTRFTKSVFITFDEKGRVVSQRFADSVIASAKRLTYLEAQALIDGNLAEARVHAKTEPEYTTDLTHALRLSDKLAKILRERRRRDGMITLLLPQSDLVFDHEGHVVDAVPEDNAFTHTLIEMFMVEANEAVARLFADLELPLIRRIHPEPAYGDIQELRLYARLAQIDLPERPSRKDIQHLLDRTREGHATRAIHFSVLRSLAKASYSPALEGHFALASEHYTHFTSPIRRYPDLLVHRALAAYLAATENGTKPPGGKQRRKLANELADDPRILDEGALIDLANQCTEREIAAESAERDLRTFLILQLLVEKHMGDEFEATVTGVAPNGVVFASLAKYLIDGAIPSRDLSGGDGRIDRWIPVAATGRLVAQRSGASIGVGDLVRVAIDKVDLAARQLSLRLVRFAEGSERLGQAALAEPRSDDDRGRQDPRIDRGGKSRKGRVDGRKRGYKQGRRGKRSK